MPPAPIPSSSSASPESHIYTSHARFVDASGRTLLLRGVNLSGSSKAPVNSPTQNLENFWETAEAGGESFVGRPLNLDDGSADVHLARLRGWGFNILRYVVTWEALEHDGPGKYDYEFMDYTVKVLQRCKQFGFRVYMDPHQDLWSRFSGGSGAPFWTLAACGLEPRHFTATQSTLLHAEYPTAEEPDPASFPAMIWSTNYFRLAVQTVFTLFFAGRDFAPKCIIDGMNIQDYLQSHFIDSMGKLADRIRDAGDLLDDCVIGWDSINEPSEGFLSHENLNDFANDAMKKGSRPTPAQSLRLGMGMAQTVENWTFSAMGPKRAGSVTIDPKGVRVWMDPAQEPNGVSTRWGWTRSPDWKLGSCLWALHDVWDPESGYVLIPDYFKSPPFAPERRISFIDDYWLPHWRAWSRRIRESHPDCIHFIQPPVFIMPPSIDEEDLRGRACYAPHYYDGLTLVTRHWNWFNADALGVLRGKYSTILAAVRIGESAIRKSIQDQLSTFLEDVKERIGPYPTMIGEIGTPFDMDSKRSYGYTDNGRYLGDYTQQQRALDASLNAGDGTNNLNWTVWTYCADSSHQWGDGWNLEDLSLWSADDLTARNGPYRMEMGQGRDIDLLNDRSDANLISRPQASEPSMLPRFDPSTSSLTTIVDSTSEPDPNGAYPLRDTASSLSKPDASANASGAVADNLYDFLTNGARAVGAFARPWPIATVGVSKEIRFTIAKAEFRLSIVVSSVDVLLAAEGQEKPRESVLPTEIFIPLVHYAADPFAKSGPRESVESYYDSPVRANRKGVSTPPPTLSINPPSPDSYHTSTSPSPVDGNSYPTTAGHSRNTTATSSFTATEPLLDDTYLTPRPTHKPVDSATTVVDPPPVWTTWRALDTPLALDIEASEGSRWEVEGQVLKWWYPIPREGEPEEERWIVVKRAGGPIKGIGSAELYLAEEDAPDSICDRLCSWW